MVMHHCITLLAKLSAAARSRAWPYQHLENRQGQPAHNSDKLTLVELKGKKVLVVGLGVSGLAAALFLRRRGAQVTVSDLRSAEELAKHIPALLDAGVNVEAGGHGHATFRRQDLIVLSPGVTPNSPELDEARTFHIPIIGEIELAARFLKTDILAITGSNGKTTTTTLAGEILKAGG